MTADQLRRREGIGVSGAVNQLIRWAVTTWPPRRRFVQQKADLGLRMDLTHTGDVLDQPEGPDRLR